MVQQHTFLHTSLSSSGYTRPQWLDGTIQVEAINVSQGFYFALRLHRTSRQSRAHTRFSLSFPASALTNRHLWLLTTIAILFPQTFIEILSPWIPVFFSCCSSIQYRDAEWTVCRLFIRLLEVNFLATPPTSVKILFPSNSIRNSNKKWSEFLVKKQ